MALASASGLASFDASDGEILDISDVLAALIVADNALLGAIGMGGECFETTHSWMEDALNARTVTQSAAALDSSTGTLTITADQGNKLRIGALLKDTAAGSTEIVQVTDITTVTLTVTRGYRTTDGEAHAASAVWRIVSQPVQENNTTTADRSTTRTKAYNYTQIFKNEVELSGTMQAVKQAGVSNELALQIEHRAQELKNELASSIVHSVRSASAGSDSVYRTMAGIREFIGNFGDATPANVDETEEALDDTIVNDLYELIWTQGASADLLVGPAKQITKFSALNYDKVRLSPSDRVRGVFVTKFLTNLGQELDLLIDREMQDDEIFILGKQRIKVMPLRGRNWQLQPLAKTGDGNSAMTIGEFTLEMHNGELAHAMHRNLTV